MAMKIKNKKIKYTHIYMYNLLQMHSVAVSAANIQRVKGA